MKLTPEQMTDTEIRIAIAEACPAIAHINTDLNEAFWTWNGPDKEFDPINDLNAMHEAEKVLDELDKTCPIEKVGYRRRYGELLVKLTNYSNPYSATARQKSEAFLSTLNKWKGQ